MNDCDNKFHMKRNRNVITFNDKMSSSEYSFGTLKWCKKKLLHVYFLKKKNEKCTVEVIKFLKMDMAIAPKCPSYRVRQYP